MAFFNPIAEVCAAWLNCFRYADYPFINHFLSIHFSNNFIYLFFMDSVVGEWAQRQIHDHFGEKMLLTP